MAIGGTPASPAFIGEWFDVSVSEEKITEQRRTYDYPDTYSQTITRQTKTYVQQNITSAENLIGLSTANKILDETVYFPNKMPLSTSGSSFEQPDDDPSGIANWYGPRISQVKVVFSPIGVATCSATFSELSVPEKVGDPLKTGMLDAEKDQ
jgi:hypothetical protein